MANPAEASSAPKFIHLKVHSAYSLLEGALPIAKLAKLAVGYGYPALGLTDTNNLFGALEFSEKLWEAGVQPIAGCTIDIDFGDIADTSNPALRAASNAPRATSAGKIALLAMNPDGYANLMRLSKSLYFECAADEPAHIKIAKLEEASAGLICLTGGPEGPIDKAVLDSQNERALERLTSLEKIFGSRLYVELQRHGLESEARVEPQLIDLAYKRGLPLVATNECYFATRNDFEAHDALLCIAEGRYVVEDNRRRATAEHYFKSADEMATLFADLPEALANTVEIAVRCAFRPKGRKPILPRFVASDDSVSELEHFRLEFERTETASQARLEGTACEYGPGGRVFRRGLRKAHRL